MKPQLGLFLLLVASLVAAGCESQAMTPQAATQAGASGTHTAGQMRAAAITLLASLTPEQRARAVFPAGSDSIRAGWSNLPANFVSRVGVSYGDLSDEQKRAAHALLRASTSSQGYQKIAGIIRLDEILHNEAEAAVRAGTRRLPPALVAAWTSKNYWFSFFGKPQSDSWSWLLSGHHLAGNFTVVGDRTSFTPLFLGAEPNEIKEGLEAGWMALSHEPDRGIELAHSLTEAQWERALLPVAVPRDILEGPGNKGRLTEYEGLQGSELSESQQALLWSLVEEFVSNADHDAAEAQMSDIRADGLDSIYFAWMGPKNDRAKPFYYRVHGPSVLIEYMVEEGVGTEAANHVHSIVRDPSNDYGEDWLGRHYEEHHSRR